MDIKIFPLIFILLVKSIVGQNSISCVYTETVNGYTCQATIYNQNGLDSFTSISGYHNVGKGDADVRSIVSSGPTSPNIPRIFCDKFENVESIYFLLFNIQRIDTDSLRNCKNLTTLDLHMNQITNIDQLAFVGTLNLTRLDLHQNKIATLPSIVFWALRNLNTLNLEGNQLATLDTNWFYMLPSLRYLHMQNNQIEELPDGMFEHLTNLFHVNLDNNKLQIIHADSFGRLPTLTIASFQNNQIDAIDERFVDSTGVTGLDLKGNLCADVNIVDTTQLRQVMRSELRECFRNYEDLNGGKF